MSASTPYYDIDNYPNRSSFGNDHLRVNTPLQEERETRVFNRTLCLSNSFYGSMLNIPDPLVNDPRIYKHYEDRNRIINLLNGAFNNVNKRSNIQAGFSFSNCENHELYMKYQNASKINNTKFTHRIEYLNSPFIPKKAIIDFFALQNLDDQESVLNWISNFRFESEKFLINTLSFLVKNPSQFYNCKLVLDSNESNQNKIGLIIRLIHEYKY